MRVLQVAGHPSVQDVLMCRANVLQLHREDTCAGALPFHRGELPIPSYARSLILVRRGTARYGFASN